MSRPRLILFPMLLLLAVATSASAQRYAAPRAVPGASPPEIDQAIYKGVVGNVLDVIPMDPARRVDLQRANAVISNTASGRTLAVLAGLSNPVLMIVGLVWGAWSASNIKPVKAEMKFTADSGQPGNGTDDQTRVVALAAPASAVENAPAESRNEPVLVSSNSAGNTDDAALSRPPVIKIWLPQRSMTLSQ